jgi:predicted ester cyclase
MDTMTTQSSEQIERNRATAARHTEAMVDGNVEALDEILAPNWVNHPIDFREGPGVEGFKAKSRWLHEHFAFAFDHQDVAAVGDKVWIRSLVTGTARGDFMGHDLAGTPVAFTTMECHRFEDGKIVESWHLQDYYAMLVQLGAMPNVMNRDLDPYQGWR